MMPITNVLTHLRVREREREIESKMYLYNKRTRLVYTYYMRRTHLYFVHLNFGNMF